MHHFRQRARQHEVGEIFRVRVHVRVRMRMRVLVVGRDYAAMELLSFEPLDEILHLGAILLARAAQLRRFSRESARNEGMRQGAVFLRIGVAQALFVQLFIYLFVGKRFRPILNAFLDIFFGVILQGHVQLRVQISQHALYILNVFLIFM